MELDRISYNLLLLQSSFTTASHTADKIYRELKENNLLDSDILNCGLLTEKAKEKIKNTVNKNKVAEIVDNCRKNEISFITIENDNYPEKLKNIQTPPLVLYLKGKMPDIDNIPSVCIVGPRKVSDFGKKAAYSIARRIAKAGVTVVSGGALGTDTAAHKGALSVNGTTLLILGCGIDYNYLPENKAMRDKISQSGCLISEFPPATAVSRFAFPPRNRILSGLCDVTLLIEAGKKSGALITASHAAEQGRDVLVLLGNPTLPQYAGSNELLRDGALPFIDTSDIFNLLIPKYPDKIDIAKAFEPTKKSDKKQQKNEENINFQKKSCEGLSKSAQMVYNYLDKPKFTADDLCGLGLDDGELLSAFTELEIEHLIKSLPGGNFALI